jgi:hypothetical protein
LKGDLEIADDSNNYKETLNLPQTDSPIKQRTMGPAGWVKAKLRTLRPNRSWAVAAALFIIPALVVPRLWCGRGADALFDGERSAQEPLAREVASWVEQGVTTEDFNTGSDRFDGEWTFGSYCMAGLGLCQFVKEHPDARDEYLPAIERCIEGLLQKRTRRFDTDAWGEDALETLAGNKGHAAYLGYMNVLLGLYRETAPGERFVEVNDAITAALVRRLEAKETLLVETYPTEGYPVDNCAVIASIALHGRSGGADHSALVRRWVDHYRSRYVHAASGMLYQAADTVSGAVEDAPRASGTALGAYFLSLAQEPFARELSDAVRRSARREIIGFGLVREYAPGFHGGRGDIDSGPVILGISFSGTGFAIAGARAAGDRAFYRELYRTSYLVGAPYRREGRGSYAMGGPLGNSIMLAMLTAPRQRMP